MCSAIAIKHRHIVIKCPPGTLKLRMFHFTLQMTDTVQQIELNSKLSLGLYPGTSGARRRHQNDALEVNRLTKEIRPLVLHFHRISLNE